jgi:hypothetical protein
LPGNIAIEISKSIFIMNTSELKLIGVEELSINEQKEQEGGSFPWWTISAVALIEKLMPAAY